MQNASGGLKDAVRGKKPSRKPSGFGGGPFYGTDFFGLKTYEALMKFQQVHNLPATGYLGPLTRATIAITSTQ